MGFQNGNDTSGEVFNEKQIRGVSGRTSRTSEYSNNTTKAQYARLGNSNSVDTRGKAIENYNGSMRTVDNQTENQASCQRTSGILAVQKKQIGIGSEVLKRTGKLDVNE